MEPLLLVVTGIAGPLLILLGWRNDGRAAILTAKVMRVASLGSYSEGFCLRLARAYLLAVGAGLTAVWLFGAGYLCFDP